MLTAPRDPEQTSFAAHVKVLFLIWIAAPVVSFILVGQSNYLGFFPSMLVHEIGHSVFSWLGGIPAISFLFASFSLAVTPVPTFVAILVVAEIFGIWFWRKQKLLLLPLLAGGALLSHLNFLLKPEAALPFLTFGGVGGEFVLPVVFLCCLLEIKRTREIRWYIAFGITCMVFWRSTMLWALAWLGLGTIPYPRDGTGGIALFQDPFAIADGAPVGDMDKLVKLYGWTEASLVQTYVVLSICCVVIFCAVWWYAVRRMGGGFN